MPKEPPKQVVNKEKSPVKAVASAVILQKSPSKGGKLDVDNFVPGLKNYVKSAILPPFHKNPCSFLDTDAIDNFLEDDGSSKIEKLSVNDSQDTDDDEVDNNPMVACYNEEIEIEDYTGSAIPDREDDHTSSSDEEQVQTKPKTVTFMQSCKVDFTNKLLFTSFRCQRPSSRPSCLTRLPKVTICISSCLNI